MKQSLSGLLNNSANWLDDRDEPTGLSFALRELLKNLRELKARKAEGEAVLDEFFNLYIVRD